MNQEHMASVIDAAEKWLEFMHDYQDDYPEDIRNSLSDSIEAIAQFFREEA
jgi:hypothetical protein